MKESMLRRRASGSWGRRARCALMKEVDEEADEEAKEASGGGGRGGEGAMDTDRRFCFWDAEWRYIFRGGGCGGEGVFGLHWRICFSVAGGSEK